MRPGQRSGERDSGSRNRCTLRMYIFERRGDSDCARNFSAATKAAKASTLACDGGDNRCLTVRATVNGDILADAKAERVGHRNNGCARFGGSAHRGAARRSHRRDDGGLLVRTRININRLTGVKARHAGDFDVVRAGDRISR